MKIVPFLSLASLICAVIGLIIGSVLNLKFPLKNSTKCLYEHYELNTCQSDLKFHLKPILLNIYSMETFMISGADASREGVVVYSYEDRSTD